MTFPNDLKYAKTDEWVKILDDGTALVGITDYAQDQLGDLVFINLPAEGDAVTAGDPFCDVESVKAVSDVNCPISGVIAEVNTDLETAPEKMNEEPYEAWIAKISDISVLDDLMSAEEYQAYREL